MEAGTPLVALGNLVLGALEEVHEGRVGLEQVPRVLEQDATHTHILSPVQLRLPAPGEGLNLRKDIFKNRVIPISTQLTGNGWHILIYPIL